MANIHKTKVEYDLLSKLSLCFCPHIYTKEYDLDIDVTYRINSTNDGYYDSKYIYDNTGYWPNELYRLGIVYILKDGSLSPVFNIRGATGLTSNSQYEFDKKEVDGKITDEFKPLDKILTSIRYSEEDFLLADGNLENENAKGVISLAPSYEDYDCVYGINIKANPLIIAELKKYVKGFFFVR
jgi:hypothetical protein